MYRKIYTSPFASFIIEASDQGITKIERIYADQATEKQTFIALENEWIQQAEKELDDYFAGVKQGFKVALDITAYSDFQQALWGKLMQIPYGSIKSYKQMAISLGDAKKVRAVGKANGSNPIPIIIPCHRVIGADGSMVGYSGGMDMKMYLLKLEGLAVQQELF